MRPGPYPATAQRDSFFVTGWQTASIRIKGLTPGALYNLRFFASGTAGDRTTRYRIENKSVLLVVAENTIRTGPLYDVAASSQGEWLIRVTTDNGAGFGHLGVLELTSAGAAAGPSSTPATSGQPAATP